MAQILRAPKQDYLSLTGALFIQYIEVVGHSLSDSQGTDFLCIINYEKVCFTEQLLSQKA